MNRFEGAWLSLLCLPICLKAIVAVLNLFIGFLRDSVNDYSFLNSIKFLPSMFSVMNIIFRTVS